MNFAFISAMCGHPWGGSEELWSQCALLLRRHGHQVLAVVKKWDTPVPQHRTLLDSGVELVEFDDRFVGRIDHAIRFCRNLGRVGVSPAAVMQRILKFRADLVCISHGSATCGVQWMLESRESRLPYVSLAQANHEQLWPSDRNYDRIVSAYLGARRAYFVSKANLKLFEKQIATRLDNAELVWNPCTVGLDGYQPWPRVDDRTESLSIACVGRLEPAAKGQDLLFEVLSQPKWKERHAKFRLFGKGNSELGTKRMAKYFGIDDQVVFEGHVTDVKEVWSNNHCLVLPSRYEGMALSLIECLLSGRPAVATSVAGNPEVISDNVTGFLSKQVDAEGLDEAMDRAWNRRGDWECMGKEAHVRMKNMLVEDPVHAFARKLEDLAKSLS
jgi:glycosyltransferase involved in cell wall biosynthesis